ncbi:MAG: DinB family protein [Chloroflexi bacterium]|nr:DinB family protein [Chloroflexota bacterium]
MTSDANRILALLGRSAHELTAVLGRIPPEHLQAAPEPGEWSVHQTLHHLWVVEARIFLPRVRRVLQEERPFLEVVDEKAVQSEWQAARPLAEMLEGFLEARRKEMLLLRGADWARVGQHETRGPITLTWIAKYALAHTWEHTAQLMRAALTAELQPAAPA